MHTNIALAVVGLALAPTASASLAFDQNVIPDAIFGGGNANGGFTTSTVDGVEIGLRAKLRFDANNNPQNTFNSNGDGSYTFQAGNPPTGFGFSPNNPLTPVWNFEWSVNTDINDTAGTPSRVLSDLTYEIGIDSDNSAGTNFLTFDPINSFNLATGAVQWDHSIGNNLTGNGQGVEILNNVSDPALYASRLATNNVAQNSWNYLFFAAGLPGFDPNNVGEYTIYLAAFENGTELTRSTITVEVVPAPGTAALLAAGALLAARRRR